MSTLEISDYRVSLDAFQGPLDLLLYLIRKSEVDIHDIPVATITAQYLAFLQQEGGLAKMDVEMAGEFLVLAATLMEIKSRMLMPKPAAAEGEDESAATERARKGEPIDPRADLVRQLLDYKRFRDAAMALEQRQAAWDRRFPAAAAHAAEAPKPPVDEDEAIDLEDVQLIDLVSAFARIMETVDFSRVGEHTVRDDETPIHLHAEDLLGRLLRDGGEARQLTFAAVFKGRTRSEAIGLFLAMLELLRHGKVTAKQDGHAGEITIRLLDDAARVGEVIPSGGAPVP